MNVKNDVFYCSQLQQFPSIVTAFSQKLTAFLHMKEIEFSDLQHYHNSIHMPGNSGYRLDYFCKIDPFGVFQCLISAIKF